MIPALSGRRSVRRLPVTNSQFAGLEVGRGPHQLARVTQRPIPHQNWKPGSCGFQPTRHPLSQLLEWGDPAPPLPSLCLTSHSCHLAGWHRGRLMSSVSLLSSLAGWGGRAAGNSWSRFSREAAAAFLAVCGGEECAEGRLGSRGGRQPLWGGAARRLCPGTLLPQPPLTPREPSGTGPSWAGRPGLQTSFCASSSALKMTLQASFGRGCSPGVGVWEPETKA